MKGFYNELLGLDFFFFLTSLPHALDILDFQGLTNKYFDQITCCVLNVSEPFSLSKL